MTYQIIDLTFPIGHGAARLEGHPVATVSTIHTFAQHGRSNMGITCSLHQGTHVDSPLHFHEGATSVDEIALERLMGPAVLVDLRGQVGSRELVTADQLGAAAAGVSLRDRILVLHTGWAGGHFMTPEYYRASPGLSAEAATWIVGQGVKALALDMPTDRSEPGSPRPGDCPGHRTVLGAGIPLIEHLANLDLVPAREFFLVAAPIKVQGGDGAPARVFAILGDGF